MRSPAFVAILLTLPLAFSGCAQVEKAASSVCSDMTAMPAAVRASLDAVDTHSVLGVYWADAKSGCANGVPTIGVSQTWTSVVWGSVKALAPIVFPYLIGLL